MFRGNFMPLIATLRAQPFSQFSTHLAVCSSSPNINSPNIICEGLAGDGVKGLAEVQVDTALPSSTRPVMSLQKFIKLVKHVFPSVNPRWLLLMIFLLFIRLEVVSRTNDSITFPGIEARLPSLYVVPWFLLLACLGDRSNFCFPPVSGHFSQSPWLISDYPEWPCNQICPLPQHSWVLLFCQPLTLGLATSAVLHSLQQLVNTSLHHFIISSRAEFLQTFEGI